MPSPETMHLIYEICATAAIIFGAGWKFLSYMNKKFENLENKMGALETRLTAQIRTFTDRVEAVENDTIDCDRRLIVLETIHDEQRPRESRSTHVAQRRPAKRSYKRASSE